MSAGTRPEKSSATHAPIRYDLMARTLPEGALDLTAIARAAGASEPLELELEIGFGRGRFLLERARAAPRSFVIGLEIKAKWAHLVELRREREKIANAIAFRADVREVLPRMGPDRSLARVFVHFPDPWWKKRHARRRVVDDDLLVHLGRLLRPEGELFIQTDVEERAASMRERIEAHGGLELFACDSQPYGARSNREARAEEDGLPVHRILARKRP